MNTKVIALIGIIVTVAIAIAVFLVSFKGNLPTNLADVKCAYIVTVSGSSMEPAIKAGTRLALSKCFKDKENLAVGTIIVWKDNAVTRVGRIKGKVTLQEGVFYKVGRDARPDDEFTVSSDDILASDEK